MANIKFSQFTVGNTESDIDFVVGYKGANNIQISPANLLSATLAGYLPLTGGTMTGNVKFNDNVKILMGSGDVFQLKHDGTNSAIQNFTGNLTIRNDENDKDIELACDDGSGGVTPYMTLDGSGVTITISAGNGMVFFDNIKAKFGNTDNLQIYHDGSDSYIDNITNHLVIQNQSANKDIIFKCDDGSGGVTTYFQLDGSLADGTNTFTKFVDNSWITMGDGGDLLIGHQTTSSKIENYTGPLYIVNKADDQDIIFQSDDGGGGIATYFKLDGSATTTVFSKNTKYNDNVELRIGNGSDFKAYHSGTNTVFENNNGHIYIKNTAVDKDIIFEGDNGSGGVAEYFKLDGSLATGSRVYTVFPDNSTAVFGTGFDFQIHHDASNTYLQQGGTGDLYIENQVDDADVIFRCDNGSGGLATYFKLDGTNSVVSIAKPFFFQDNVKIYIGNSFDLEIYHDTTNSIINNKTNDLIIQNSADDKDIIFQSDDGSGGVLEYLRLDGSTTKIQINREMQFFDNVKATFGFAADLQIYHDGSNSYIQDSGTGDLRIWADSPNISTASGNKIFYGNNGAAELYHTGGVKKFETTSTGIKISGVSEYADNTAAIAGGLTTGDVYRTGDLLKIVH